MNTQRVTDFGGYLLTSFWCQNCRTAHSTFQRFRHTFHPRDLGGIGLIQIERNTTDLYVKDSNRLGIRILFEFSALVICGQYHKANHENPRRENQFQPCAQIDTQQ